MITTTINARRKDLGGFEVGRVLPWAKHRMVGPFIFYDHMGPVTFPPHVPRSTDVRPHPHIGLATITYLLAGEIVHRDSLGRHQVIRPGEVNWMTAGRGITHSERFETMREHGGYIEGLQAWVALPQEHEEVEPSFVHFDKDALPTIDRNRARIRLIAGAAFGMTSPVRTHSPLLYAHIEAEAGSVVSFESDFPERAFYVVRGRVRIEDDFYESGQMIVFAAGGRPSFEAAEASTVMALGGEPVGPRFISWNFVSSSAERIERARQDWKAGRFALPAGDDQEFIPLPEDSPPPEPMS